MMSDSFRVSFVGMPDEFRRAHRAGLTELGARVEWVDRIEDLAHGASPAPTALVLNLDEPSHSELATWERLRSAFPQTDRVAISGRDSAQLAMQCLREGFSDFLTQPVSHDELALCLLRCRHRRGTVSRKAFPQSEISRAFTQISTSASDVSLRVRTLTALQTLLGAQNTVWFQSHGTRARVLAAYPTAPNKEVQHGLIRLGSQRRKVLRGSDGRRRVLLRCRREKNGVIAIWGVRGRLTRARLDQALAIVEHAELALVNLQRVEKLKLQTFIDDLTGLYNSRYLRFALETAAANQQTKKEPFALLFIDVDKFKMVNDRHGHLVGSEFLGALGRIIKNAVRRGDVVFRYGGDEFVVLLRNTGLGRAQEVAERLRSHIEARHFVIRDVPLRATLSLGLAVCPEHSSNLDRLIQLADGAMYAAKRTRNQVAVADASKTGPGRRRPALQPTL